MYEVQKKDSLGKGLQDSINSKDTSVHRQCQWETSPSRRNFDKENLKIAQLGLEEDSGDQ